MQPRFSRDRFDQSYFSWFDLLTLSFRLIWVFNVWLTLWNYLVSRIRFIFFSKLGIQNKLTLLPNLILYFRAKEFGILFGLQNDHQNLFEKDNLEIILKNCNLDVRIIPTENIDNQNLDHDLTKVVKLLQTCDSIIIKPSDISGRSRGVEVLSKYDFDTNNQYKYLSQLIQRIITLTSANKLIVQPFINSDKEIRFFYFYDDIYCLIEKTIPDSQNDYNSQDSVWFNCLSTTSEYQQLAREVKTIKDKYFPRLFMLSIDFLISDETIKILEINPNPSLNTTYRSYLYWTIFNVIYANQITSKIH
jgi:hypothetical protein